MRDVMATPIIFGVVLLQLAQGVLIRPASELFPAYATTIFRGGETALGLLNAAVGLGAVAGALALSKTREKRAALVQIFGMSTLFAISMLVFSMTHVLWLGLLLLFIYGMAMSSSNIAALAFVQLNTPSDRLGRVLSLYAIVFRVGPSLGAILFGTLAEKTSLEINGLCL